VADVRILPRLERRELSLQAAHRPPLAQPARRRRAAGLLRLLALAERRDAP